jgi:hypothetical protein
MKSPSSECVMSIAKKKRRGKESEQEKFRRADGARVEWKKEEDESKEERGQTRGWGKR